MVVKVTDDFVALAEGKNHVQLDTSFTSCKTSHCKADDSFQDDAGIVAKQE